MKILKDFLNLLFPENCFACNHALTAGEKTICISCLFQLPYTNHIKESENELKKQFLSKINFKFAGSLLYYKKEGIAKQLIKNLKYNNEPEVGHFLGNLMAQELSLTERKDWFESIIPVPLHQKRKKTRGYNQAEEIAKPIAEKLKIELNLDSVIRQIHNQTQTKVKSRERWDNVKDIFLVTKPENIENKNILIVDDVITTGSTIESLATEILKHNPKSISLLAVANASENAI